MRGFPDHPVIQQTERTGYHSWMQEDNAGEIDEDRAYEERRDQQIYE